MGVALFQLAQVCVDTFIKTKNNFLCSNISVITQHFYPDEFRDNRITAAEEITQKVAE